MAQKTLWRQFATALSKSPDEAFAALKVLLTNKSMTLLRHQTAQKLLKELFDERNKDGGKSIVLDCKRKGIPGYLTISIKKVTNEKKSWHEVCLSSVQFGGKLHPPEKRWTKVG